MLTVTLWVIVVVLVAVGWTLEDKLKDMNEELRRIADAVEQNGESVIP